MAGDIRDDSIRRALDPAVRGTPLSLFGQVTPQGDTATEQFSALLEADPQRISVEQWRLILAAIRDYHVLLAGRLGRPVETRLIWHGGEPLLLPAGHLDEVMALQHDVLAGLPHRLPLQTNLYPAHAEPFAETAGGRCPVTAGVHDHIEHYLRGNGFGPDRLLGWLHEDAATA
jgi:hypothetical protein